MKSLKFSKLLQSFSRARQHREATAKPLNEDWDHRVMRAVRTLQREPSRSFLPVLIEHWFWRWLPACALIIVLLCYVLGQMGAHPEYEITEMLIQQPAEAPLILSFFG